MPDFESPPKLASANESPLEALAITPSPSEEKTVRLGDIFGSQLREAGERAVLERIAREQSVQESDLKRDEDAASEKEFQAYEKEAHRERGRRLREIPALQVLFEVLKSTPDIYFEVIQELERKADFIEGAARPGEKHRQFSALFAGIALNDRASALLDLAIERTMQSETAWFWEKIRTGENYTSELVIGSGPESANYNNERMIFHPADPAMTLERRKRVGGQFSIAKSASARPVWKMNSRVRPENPDMPNLPGTAASLNTQGRGVLQESDLSGEAYTDNTKIAMATRVNLLLNGRMMTGVELRRVELNPDFEQGGKGKYRVEVYREESGQTAEITTDRIVLIGGIGKSVSGLDEEDPETKAVLAEQQKLFEETGKAKVLLFNQHAEQFADISNRYPLRGRKREAVIGSKDGGRVVVGGLLGYEGQMGNSVSQLDRVEEVVWFGQPSASKEEFVQSVRLRYAQLGLEFPRESYEDYYSRIQPVKDKGFRLIDSGDTITVITENGSVYEGFDHVTIATGFEDETEKIIQPLFSQQFTDQNEVLLQARSSFFTKGAKVFYDEGVNRSVEVTDIQKVGQSSLSVTVMTTLRNGAKLSSTTVVASDQKSSFVEPFITNQYFKRFEVPTGELELEPIFDEGGTEAANNIPYSENTGSASPIATKYAGQEIYRSGPAAQLTLTEAEKGQSEVFKIIPENTIALFRYTEYARRLARLLAEKDFEEGKEEKGLTAEIPKSELVEVPEIGEFKESQRPYPLLVPAEVMKEGIPSGASRGDFLRFAIGERLSSRKFPENFPSLELQITRFSTIDPTDGDVGLMITVKPALPSTPELDDMIYDILRDPVTEKILAQYTDENFNRSETATLSIPFSKGKLDIPGIEMRRSQRPRREAVDSSPQIKSPKPEAKKVESKETQDRVTVQLVSFPPRSEFSVAVAVANILLDIPIEQAEGIVASDRRIFDNVNVENARRFIERLKEVGAVALELNPEQVKTRYQVVLPRAAMGSSIQARESLATYLSEQGLLSYKQAKQALTSLFTSQDYTLPYYFDFQQLKGLTNYWEEVAGGGLITEKVSEAAVAAAEAVKESNVTLTVIQGSADLQPGSRVTAIKALRTYFNLGLKEAKDIIVDFSGPYQLPTPLPESEAKELKQILQSCGVRLLEGSPSIDQSLESRDSQLKIVNIPIGVEKARLRAILKAEFPQLTTSVVDTILKGLRPLEGPTLKIRKVMNDLGLLGAETTEKLIEN